MREFINIVESHDDPGHDQALALMRQYGSKPLSFEQLPPGAKKAIHQWMMVDGDNPDYKTNCFYSYGEIPTEVFMDNYLEGIVRFDPALRDEYVNGETMTAKDRATHPSKSSGFGGYDYSKHNLKEPWPVVIGSEFFEDGAHRLGLYVHSGMKTIPAVMIFDAEDN